MAPIFCAVLLHSCSADEVCGTIGQHGAVDYREFKEAAGDTSGPCSTLSWRDALAAGGWNELAPYFMPPTTAFFGLERLLGAPMSLPVPGAPLQEAIKEFVSRHALKIVKQKLAALPRLELIQDAQLEYNLLKDCFCTRRQQRPTRSCRLT